MDRDKQRKELIKREKSLKISYNKRKQNLLKKGYELATLCGVDLCVIVFDPKQRNEHVEPETWPVDSQQVKNIIRQYQRKEQEKRSFLYVSDNSEKIPDDFTNSCEKRRPEWIDWMNECSEHELQQFLCKLEDKIKVADEKIRILMNYSQLGMVTGACQVGNGQELKLFPGNQNFVETVEVHEQHNDWNWDYSMVHNNNIASTSETQFPQLHEPVYFDPALWNSNNSMVNNANPWLSYNDPTMQSILTFPEFPYIYDVPLHINSSESNETINFFQQNNSNAMSWI
ncbi:agamous-like MADS-box protein AGL11 [Mercurialis annua]|uniref:agamous-like MADS-box protein AGL11 n=1 Tax=Mercurialis annua TaxID=3986 RepID=UPI00215DF538|nr:agamous-like MADS-box protein AGL11 [Mercurialis annua]